MDPKWSHSDKGDGGTIRCIGLLVDDGKTIEALRKPRERKTPASPGSPFLPWRPSAPLCVIPGVSAVFAFAGGTPHSRTRIII